MVGFGALPVGTNVIAAADFGPVIRGQIGTVTARSKSTHFLQRRWTYTCTFLGGIHVLAIGTQIARYDHGICREMLEDPLWFLRTRGTPRKGHQLAVELRHPGVDHV